MTLRILKKAGLGSHVAARVPLLSAKHKAARLAFAKKMIYYNWSQACLYLVPAGPDRMDSTGYQMTVLRPNTAFLTVPRSVFQQDGASCHTSKSTLRFLKNQKIKVLPDWPAMSPYLNLVEHCWAWLAKQVSGQAFSTTDDLWAALQHEWAHVPPKFIPILYEHGPGPLWQHCNRLTCKCQC